MHVPLCFMEHDFHMIKFIFYIIINNFISTKLQAYVYQARGHSTRFLMVMWHSREKKNPYSFQLEKKETLRWFSKLYFLFQIIWDKMNTPFKKERRKIKRQKFKTYPERHIPVYNKYTASTCEFYLGLDHGKYIQDFQVSFIFFH